MNNTNDMATLWPPIGMDLDAAMSDAEDVLGGLSDPAIDVDGSFWVDPVLVSGTAELGFNHDRGQIKVLADDPNTAEYMSQVGGLWRLTRGPTVREFPICA